MVRRGESTVRTGLSFWGIDVGMILDGKAAFLEIPWSAIGNSQLLEKPGPDPRQPSAAIFDELVLIILIQ